MGTSAPEVKRLPLSQRLNGKKMATRAASLTGFLLFFVTCHAARDVTQCHAICIFFYLGGSHMKGAGMLVGNFEKPLGVGQPFFDP